MLEEGKAKSLREIAETEKVDNSYVSWTVDLTLLAPDVVVQSWETSCPREPLFLFSLDVPAVDTGQGSPHRLLSLIKRSANNPVAPYTVSCWLVL